MTDEQKVARQKERAAREKWLAGGPYAKTLQELKEAQEEVKRLSAHG